MSLNAQQSALLSNAFVAAVFAEQSNCKNHVIAATSIAQTGVRYVFPVVFFMRGNSLRGVVGYPKRYSAVRTVVHYAAIGDVLG